MSTSDTAASSDQLRRALSSLRDMRGRLEAAEAVRTEPIAIVGIGCRFPGADGPDEYWELLRRGDDAIVETPADRWDADPIFEPSADARGKVATRWGGFVDRIDEFDATFFGISPREAAHMDPQQRMLLEVAWEALEDGGQDIAKLAGGDTGVFVGIHSHSSDYYLLQAAEERQLDMYSGTGTSHSVASGRLSYVFDWRGPSVAVDTACSSSLVAVHLAVRSLRNRECSLAMAGGVNAIIDPTFTMVASRMRMMSPSGRCKPFDAGGDGFVRSEGCGVVLLKRLSDAIADGDRVLAVIRGSAVNQDGRSNGLTAPNSISQQAVIRAAIDDAGVDPADVGMIETHGTGTPLGDPIEIEALTEIFGGRGPEREPCTLGSAKANIGHCEGAAGVAGLIKAVLTLRAGQIPPLVHFNELNPHISLDGTPLRIPTSLLPWPAGDRPRCAGVSSFGWSGTNAHVVVSEAPASPPVLHEPSDRPHLLPISARSEDSLRTLAGAYRASLERAEPHEVDEICAAAALRRSHLEHRMVVVGRERDQLIERLDSFLAGDAQREVAIGPGPHTGAELIVFVCPGQGSQWDGMARQLLEQEPVFREAIERCDMAMAPFVDWSLVERITMAEATERADDIDVVQPTLFAIQVALAELWRSYGVVPDAVVGHSMGEVAAAHIAGALSLDDAAKVICWRSNLLRRISGRGAMAVVELDIDSTRRAITGVHDRLAVAVNNARNSTVVSGDPAALDELLTALAAEDVFCRRVQVDVASHSPQVDELLDELIERVGNIELHAARIPMMSTVTATLADGIGLDARYWARNMRDPVQFAAAIEKLIDGGHGRFVELSPHPVLVLPIEQTLAARDARGVAIASMYRDSDERVGILAALAALFADGVDLDWRAFHEGRVVTTALPRYPWERERHWLESADASRRQRRGAKDDPLLGWSIPIADAGATLVWENDLDQVDLPVLYDHRLGGRPSAPASALAEMMLRAARYVAVDTLGDVVFERLLHLDADTTTRVQVTIDRHARRVAVYSWSGETWMRHAVARLCDDELQLARQDASIELASEPGEGPYVTFDRVGVDLGPTLRSIVGVQTDGQISVGEVRADAAVNRELVAIDSCLQLAAATALDGDTDPDALRMPVSIRRLRRRPVASDRLVCVLDRMGLDPAAPTWGVDVDAYDADGDPVAAVEGLVLRRVGTAADRLDDCFHEVAWRIEGDWEPPEPTDIAERTWIVLADDEGYAAALARRLSGRTTSCVLVRPGAHFARLGPDHYEVELGHPDQLARILAEHSGERGAEIVFMWGLDAGDGLDIHTLEDTQRLGCGGLLDCVQAIEAGNQSCTIRVVTKGVQRVGATDGGSALAQATLWGLGRALDEEMADRWSGLVDLDPTASVDAAVEPLAALLLAGERDTEVAIRDANRHVARIVRHRVAATTAPGFRPDATVLVTGGFGAIGRLLAEWLVEHGARRLVLVGRTELPPRGQWAELGPESSVGSRVAFVRHLERLGASVHVASIDVADAEAVRNFAADFDAEGWPPIRSAFHAAALFGGELLVELGHDRLVEQLMPKLVGAWTLSEVFDLDHLVLFSSLAAFLPVPGQGAYAAANAFLDALATWRAGRGLPALSVNWGYWQETGEAVRGADHAGDGHGPRVANLEVTAPGTSGLASQRGLDALGRLLSERRSRSIVAPIDWAALARSRTARPLGLAAELAQSESAADRGPAPDEATLAAELKACPPGDRRDIAEAGLRRIVGGVLKMPGARIGDLQPFGTLGLDSLMAIELRTKLEEEVDVGFSATVAWNYPTISELARLVLDKLGLGEPAADSSDQRVPSSEGGRSSGAVGPHVALSDEVALAALIGEEER